MQTIKAIAIAAGTLGLAAAANAQAWTGFQFGGAGDVVVIPINVDDTFPPTPGHRLVPLGRPILRPSP